MLLLLTFSSCTPTCESVCKKLVEECEDLATERMTAYECEVACQEQDRLLAEWTDEQRRDAFEAERECIGEATCGEIADGVCYDDDLWAF